MEDKSPRILLAYPRTETKITDIVQLLVLGVALAVFTRCTPSRIKMVRELIGEHAAEMERKKANIELQNKELSELLDDHEM